MTAPSLREAATMALSALKYHEQQTRPVHFTSETIAILTAAIALPEAEPVAIDLDGCTDVVGAAHINGSAKVILHFDTWTQAEKMLTSLRGAVKAAHGVKAA